MNFTPVPLYVFAVYALKESFSLRMEAIVETPSELFACFCTLASLTRMNGFIFFSSPMVLGTEGSFSPRISSAHANFFLISSLSGST